METTISMRPLNPLTDVELVLESLTWINAFPDWYKRADAVWGAEDLKGCLADMLTQAQIDVGVFEDEQLTAVINISLVSKNVYNVHLMSKRGTNVESLVMAAASVRETLFSNGAREVWAWPAKRNRGVQRILEAIGMVKDGVELIKGIAHGKPITWVRYWIRSEI